MQKINKVLTIENKVLFKEENFYSLSIPRGLEILVKAGDIVTENQPLVKAKETENVIEAGYEGIPSVTVGDNVQKDDVISVKGKIIPKKILSPCTGKVVKITDTSINIEIKPELAKKSIEVVSPFNCIIDKVSDNRIMLKFSALTLNLFDSKGEGAAGRVVYLPVKNIKAGKIPEDLVKDAILITDKITMDTYPLLTTLGAKGVITNSIDYYLYRDMIILAVPVGIISGFGLLDEDSTLVKYFSGISMNVAFSNTAATKFASGKRLAWFDTIYSRLLIPEEKAPVWAGAYKFDLGKAKIS